MTTMEKLFVQIFERKRWVIDQVKHQSHLFDQHLASTLLIDGIPPPPWLLPHSHSSDPTELKKEELISGLLIPFPQASAPYSISHNSMCNQPIFAADSGQLGSFYGDACTMHGRNEARGETSVLREAVSNHGCFSKGAPTLIDSPLAKSPHECVLNDAPEPIPTPTTKSPQDQSEAKVLETYHSLDQSLARVQRSKPRQKYLELRNSVNASKSSLHGEYRTIVDPITVAGPGNAHSLVNHLDPVVSGLQPLCAEGSANCVSSCSIAEKYGAHAFESSLKSNNRAFGVLHNNVRDSQEEDKNRSCFCGNMTRTQKSTRTYYENEFSKLSGSCAIDHEVRTSIEEAIHVNSTGKLKESSGMQEAKIDICQLENGGFSTLQQSANTGGEKGCYSRDKLMQLQQVEASSGRQANPLKWNSLGSTAKHLTSTASEKPTSAKLSTNHTQQNASSSQMDILSGKGDDVDLETCGKNAAEMRVAYDNKPSEDFSVCISSNLDFDNSKNEARVLISGLSADGSMHLEPKQLEFDDAAKSNNGLNEIPGTASEKRLQEDVQAQGLTNSLDQENDDREKRCLYSSEACVKETGEGSKITGQDAKVLLSDAFKAATSLSSDFLLERETSNGQFSVLENKISIPFVGKNVLHNPPDFFEHSSLSTLKSVERMDLSAERCAKQFDTAKPSKLGSHGNKVGNSACIGSEISADLKIRKPAASTMSRDPDLKVGDHAVEVHGNVPLNTSYSLLHDMNVADSLCRGAGPVEDCTSGQQDVCSNLDDHNNSGNSVLSGQMSSPHPGSSWPQSRRRSVGKGHAALLTASPTWKVASTRNSRGYSQDRNSSGVECHIEDAPNAEEIITSHGVNATGSSVNCNPVSLDEQNLEGCVVEGFQISPVQQDREGDPGPSLDNDALTQSTADMQVSLSGKTEITGPSRNVLGPIRMCTEDEVKNQQQAKVEYESGETEQSDSSEGPVEGKTSHFEEPSQFDGSPLHTVELTNADQVMPVLEGFFMQTADEESYLSKATSSFERSDVHDTTVERASLIEQLCKSTCLHTPSTHLSTADKLQKGSNLYQRVPNGFLEYIDLKCTQHLEDDINGLSKGGFFKKGVGCAFDEKLSSDFLPVSGDENGRKPYISPVGKMWEKIKSNSGSSKDKASSNPELPCISRENEITEEATDMPEKEISFGVVTSSAKRKPLADITEDPNCNALVSELENHRCSLESVNTEFSFSGTNKRPKQKLGTYRTSKKRHTCKIRDSKAIPRGARAAKVPLEILHNSVTETKTSLQRDGLGISRMEVKRGNIVCNMTSFVPLVQQKQAPVPLTGKRDVKVKALEAAEAARRQAEKREIERKMKKEALKLERARLEQENMRQMEIQKKRKEEERKIKEAEIATRKRLREEEERREKERKRKRADDARKHQEDQRHKLCPKKEEKEIRPKSTVGEEKKDNLKILLENEGAEKQSSETVLEEGTLVPETPNHFSHNSKVTSIFNQGKNELSEGHGIEEQPYEISPYQCSDDEDEEGDDSAPRKFIPSWASKNRIAQAISTQYRVDPDLILPPDSFCCIDEVVLPRKLRVK